MKLAFLMLPLISSLALAGCAPKIYLIDRQTILEEEAAGEWPDFEKEFLDHAEASGPTPFQKVPVNEHKTRLYTILNADTGK